MILRGEMAVVLAQAGEAAAGLEMIEDLIVRCEQSEERWYVPEALRIKGELTLASGSHAAAANAEALLLRADRLAGAQHARAWQLRTAISLARLRRAQGREKEARSALGRIVASFTEGFGTIDLRTAQSLLTG